jgi:CheY-like chemotaxis protein
MPSILIIEYDSAVGQLFETALRSAGYDVYLAGTAAEGYEMLRRISVEMVITDINMPSGTGLQVISAVRHDFPDTKIVGISREASEFDPLKAAPLLNTVEVLSNPIGVKELLGTVQRVLGGPG